MTSMLPAANTKRIALLSVIILVMGAIMVVGCTPEDEEVIDDPDEPTERDDGGTFVFANEQTPDSLDPHYVRDVGSTRAIFWMYNALIRLNPEMEFEPELATSWEISDDNLTYTFELREGVKFHDGTEFNADAVKANFERHMENEDTRYHDDVVQDIAKIEVIDDFTIEFHLNEVNVQWFYDLSQRGYYMLSPTALDEHGEDFAQHPVGTGPFKLKEYEPDSHIHYEAFEDYWEGTPKLDELHVRIIPERSVQVMEAEAGNIDFAVTIQAEDVERLEGAGLDIHSTYTPTATFISMHLGEPPIDELAVRRAIRKAVNTEGVLSELLHGYGTISRGGQPDSDWPLYNPDIPIVGYDPDEAARILDEAGWVLDEDDGIRYRDGEPLEVLVLSTDIERELDYGLMNEIIEDALAEIGFKTSIETLDWGAYLDRFRAGENWHVTFHAQNQRDPTVAYGAELNPDGYWNINKHHLATKPELVESANRIRDIYDELSKTPDMQDRVDLWAEVQEIAHDQALIDWLVHWEALYAINPRVQDIEIVPITTELIYNSHKLRIEGN